MVWLTDERRLALFLAGTIVRDPHHRQSPARRKQCLSLGFAQNLSSIKLNKYIMVVTDWLEFDETFENL